MIDKNQLLITHLPPLFLFPSEALTGDPQRELPTELVGSLPLDSSESLPLSPPSLLLSSLALFPFSFRGGMFSFFRPFLVLKLDKVEV